MWPVYKNRTNKSSIPKEKIKYQDYISKYSQIQNHSIINNEREIMKIKNKPYANKREKTPTPVYLEDHTRQIRKRNTMLHEYKTTANEQISQIQS